MTVFNNTSPTPLTLTQVSVLDFFVPGSTSILAAIELVLATNSYFRPLFLCMLLAFLSTHVRRYSIFNIPVKCTIWLLSGLPLNHSLTGLGHPRTTLLGTGRFTS
ncbi:uncharacterized protein PODANS_5_7400 [Podospora anserina S mat+]|uniref:Podospora anserina S mat+ genomic DNA chromosome 5, supercontig 8 n=1 Tax=Podospora anserina (strain S / ATCC MYA-4624 / DSM 980 / FGSC 10383) TaxID=515849 RepID=B2AMB1_PODAN|nr:uncharacterized protein PODANS_5_7400 [Podospora anserina S mat+]CAP65171.1 unnamed protein product [Podospora anserina S mat+]CDP29740.1 Putative protein of unknown function [Podospora anserina S mat+]